MPCSVRFATRSSNVLMFYILTSSRDTNAIAMPKMLE
jgi:hypothetical protein